MNLTEESRLWSKIKNPNKGNTKSLATGLCRQVSQRISNVWPWRSSSSQLPTELIRLCKILYLPKFQSWRQILYRKCQYLRKWHRSGHQSSHLKTAHSQAWICEQNKKNWKKTGKTWKNLSSLKRMQVNCESVGKLIYSWDLNLCCQTGICIWHKLPNERSYYLYAYTCRILLQLWIDLNRFVTFIMTKRYRGRRHQEGRAKQLCRLSSSAGAAVVAARQPLEVSKKHGKIFEDLEEFHVWHFSSLWRFHLISSFSPHGAAPSSRGTARCGGRWPVREAVHRCHRRCRRLQQLQQLGLRFAKNSVNHWQDRSVANWRKSSWNLSWTLSAEDFEPVSILTPYIPVSALVHSGLSPIKSFSQPVQPAIIPQGSLPVSETTLCLNCSTEKQRQPSGLASRVSHVQLAASVACYMASAFWRSLHHSKQHRLIHRESNCSKINQQSLDHVWSVSRTWKLQRMSISKTVMAHVYLKKG